MYDNRFIPCDCGQSGMSSSPFLFTWRESSAQQLFLCSRSHQDSSLRGSGRERQSCAGDGQGALNKGEGGGTLGRDAPTLHRSRTYRFLPSLPGFKMCQNWTIRRKPQMYAQLLRAIRVTIFVYASPSCSMLQQAISGSSYYETHRCSAQRFIKR